MRSQIVLSSFVLLVSALAACSAQSESTPPRGSGGSGTSTGGTAAGGTSQGFAGTGTGFAGTGTGFGGAPGTGGTSTGFGGAPPAGGATGSAGTGTAGSSAVGVCKSTVVGMGNAGTVDDFETHTAGSTLLPGGATEDGRVGGWNIDKSPSAMSTSTAAPVTGGNPGMALHFMGTDTITSTPPGWGADAAVAIAGPGNCYDASAYHTGLSIDLKSGTGPTTVVVSLQTAEVLATNYASGPNGKMISITGDWATYPIAYTDLATTYGTPVPLDLKSVHAVVIATSATGAANFDIYVDNLKFVP
jgi:hypothetical protein